MEPSVELARRRVRERRRSRSTFARPMRWAAILVIGGATGLAAAVPGSPVREWLMGGSETPAVMTVETGEEGAPGTLEVPAEPAGVSVHPPFGRMLVRFADASEGLRIRLHLDDGDEVEVRVASGQAHARFHTGPERIEVRGAAHGEADIRVPRGLAGFTLEVAGRTYMVKRGEDLRFPGPPADRAGPAIEFEVRP